MGAPAIDRFVDIRDLGKSYATPAGQAVIVSDFSLAVRRGEFVCLLGHSGCGKSTVLSILMGLTPPTEGTVVVGGREVAGPGPDRGVVFQAPTLLPWLTVGENVRLAVEQAGGRVPAASRAPVDGKRLALRYLDQVGLAAEASRLPRELSAGMQQRVGIARAFALEPRLLLLDEPFSLLDAMTRMELQDELMRLWQRERKTVLMVTHDVDEALLLADRIVLMTSGPAATVGGVVEVPFPRPRSREQVLAHPEYYRLRDQVIEFLDSTPSGSSAPGGASA